VRREPRLELQSEYSGPPVGRRAAPSPPWFRLVQLCTTHPAAKAADICDALAAFGDVLSVCAFERPEKAAPPPRAVTDSAHSSVVDARGKGDGGNVRRRQKSGDRDDGGGDDEGDEDRDGDDDEGSHDDGDGDGDDGASGSASRSGKGRGNGHDNGRGGDDSSSLGDNLDPPPVLQPVFPRWLVEFKTAAAGRAFVQAAARGDPAHHVRGAPCREVSFVLQDAAVAAEGPEGAVVWLPCDDTLTAQALLQILKVSCLCLSV
jgi:hypothetical protein